MGKRAREKRERRERIEKGEVELKREKPEIRPVAICKGIILLGTGLSLFAPLFVSGKFFFPFVGPKSLYFMAFVEVIFVAWLILQLFSKNYRPKLNILLAVLIIFVVVLIFSSVFGADFSRSFWSKYERMTGLLMWFHLLAFFLVISSTFRKKSDWLKIFSISIFVAVIISVLSLPKIGESIMKGYPTRGGATIGNSSFLGTYLLFNIFLALYLLTQARQSRAKGEDEAIASSPLQSRGRDARVLRGAETPVLGLKVYSGISLAIIALALLLSDARAAILSVLGGLILLFLFWLIFCKKGKLRLAGISLLIIFVIGFLSLVYFSLQPGDFLYQKMVARYVVWEIAWNGFWESPWLGWGPENFELAFTKYFDPRLALPQYGGEVWFDRTHNILLDTLVASGVVGLLSYFAIFLTAFLILWRQYFRKKIDFLTFGIISVILISYSVQNLTVFDMVNSYLMWFLILGFVGSIASQKDTDLAVSFSPGPHKKTGLFKKLFLLIVLIIFGFSFSRFVIQPLKADAYVIKAIRAQDSTQRLSLYKATLETSPLGKYQIREFFGDSVIQSYFSQAAATTTTGEKIIAEFDFVSKELEKSIKESPLDYRAYLKLGKVYNAWSMFDATKISLAEEASKKAIEMSPRNQQTYWELAQTKINQRDYQTALSLAEKAVELEPRVSQSQLILVRVCQIMGDYNLAREKAKAATEINPSLAEQFKDILGE